jgi:hypothetical protein
LALLYGLLSMVVGLAQPRYGGVCEDAFGVESMAVVLADGLVSLPLMGIAVVVADEGKTSLSRGDQLLVACGWLFMPILVVMFTADSVVVEVACMVLASLLFIPVFYAFLLLRRAARTLATDIEAATSSRKWLSQLQLAQARQYLAGRLLFIMPVFPLTHVLAVAGVIDSEVLQVVYLLAALLYKVWDFSALAVRLRRTHGLLRAKHFSIDNRCRSSAA